MLAEYLWLSTSAHDGKEIDAMAESIMRRMREIIDRELPEARFVVSKAMAVGTKSTATLTGMPRGSNQSSQVERGEELLDVAKAEEATLEEELSALRDIVAPHINALGRQDERMTMRIRYLVGYNIQDTADILGRSVRNVQRVLQKAEQQVARAVVEMSADVR